ncbi:MAG: SprT-like domain-containing protein [Gammaproteobacteria bacterium]|nr:SprT-like domain-containing protein [Gammaproteobacteria bacterium]
MYRHSDLITPIDSAVQQQVTQATHACIRNAEEIYRRKFKLLPVTFDLIGRAAGMYRVDGRGRVIRYNPYLFAKYYEDSMGVTVPHEVAHYVTDVLYGLKHVRPHGIEWRTAMTALGADHRRSAPYDLTGIPTRCHRRFRYHCRCRELSLSARSHNRVKQGRFFYICHHCGEHVIYSGCSEKESQPLRLSPPRRTSRP